VVVATIVVAVGDAVTVNRTELDVDVVEDVGVAKDNPASATEDGQSSSPQKTSLGGAREPGKKMIYGVLRRV
jgi:hypothetical protein